VRKAAAGLIVAAVLILLAPAGPARADDDGVRLQVEVTAEETGKPIVYAAVYVKFKEKRLLWKDKKREWQVKTNLQGKAVFPAMPEGQALVQVIAKGWKTYGRFLELKGPKHVLEIKLEKPKRWY
jgi:hypothetical protein